MYVCVCFLSYFIEFKQVLTLLTNVFIKYTYLGCIYLLSLNYGDKCGT